jgi:allophanate hydrolase
MFRLAVAGAHLSGFPLNHQLLGLGAKLVGPVSTAPVYKMYDLGGVKPSLVRQAENSCGASIELELWDIPMDKVGTFIRYLHLDSLLICSISCALQG